MTLIILLLAVGIERYLHFSQFLYRFNWFGSYLKMWRKGLQTKNLKAQNLWQGYLGLVLIALPILILVAIIYYALWHLLYGIVGLLLGTAILLYCLGPKDLYSELEFYFTLLEQGKKEQAEQAMQEYITVAPDYTASFERKLSEATLMHFNQRIFAVIFWFVVLGPLGAVFYRIIDLTYRAATKSAGEESSILQESHQVLAILNWVPIRLLGLAYALVGHYAPGFKYWLAHVKDGLSANTTFALESAFFALEVNPKSKGDLEENKEVVGLIDRSLIFYLVIVAVFTLGAIMY